MASSKCGLSKKHNRRTGVCLYPPPFVIDRLRILSFLAYALLLDKCGVNARFRAAILFAQITALGRIAATTRRREPQ
jgi:hypothetical protein